MPVSWTAFMDQRLLVAVLAAVKLHTAVVVAKWQDLFGRDDVEQPTQRAIVKHIGKLKKTLDISGGKTSGATSGVKKEPKGVKTPKNKKQKFISAPLTPPGSADHDDDERGSLMKGEITDQDSPSPTKKRLRSKTFKANTSSKRRRANLSDEEDSMSDGGDAEDDASPAEPSSVKNEDDEFVVPGEMRSNNVSIPARSQRPRRAKAERKPILINDDTTEDECDIVEEAE
ncbi:uncharacterized protein CLAFUR5_04016 [Fulvia fulva]|uniref:Uncharacterized protein n=1 Tax=Passalora fulva TaxID=5499 RepID=A0A9Q8P7W6_PASFU|nr:uncharacterized protein CLAFUR5_04016 [Fulvia fulva]KAK4627380.1 hypothetical protein CLAFUR0_04039 [Fulvia fulva]UJO16544.1 hypothetical protein CLAFUR5_04016 [Fulvia fulva]